MPCSPDLAMRRLLRPRRSHPSRCDPDLTTRGFGCVDGRTDRPEAFPTATITGHCEASNSDDEASAITTCDLARCGPGGLLDLGSSWPATPAPSRLPNPNWCLRKGDRIILIGNTFAERMQYYGHFETLLHARFPELELVFHNLGYSADELALRPRQARFNDHGHTLKDEKPDVLFAAFGFNESFAGPKPAWQNSRKTSRTSSRHRPRPIITAKSRRDSCCSRRSRRKTSRTRTSPTASRTT